MIKKFVRAILPMIIVFLWNAIINDWLGFYEVWPDVDIPMHVIGGFVTAWSIQRLFTVFISSISPKKLLMKPVWLFGLFLIALTALVAIFWEVYEFWLQRFTGFVTQPSIADVIKDQVLGVIGATVYVWAVWRRKK